MYYLVWRERNGESCHTEVYGRDTCRMAFRALFGRVEFVEYYRVDVRDDYSFCEGWYQ